MTNKGLLTAITVILLGIFTVVLIESTDRTPAENFSHSVHELTEEIGDEIDDATTN